MSAGRESRRARAREVDALVLEVTRAMVDGEWCHELRDEIAAREGVDPSAVEDYAKQAGRLLRIGPDVETYRAINLRRLDETYAQAGGDGKVRVAAVSEQNKMLGLHAPVKVEATVQAIAKLSTREQLAKAREALAALPETIRMLESKLAEENAITVPALLAEGTEP